jgi:hypothetical protein
MPINAAHGNKVQMKLAGTIVVGWEKMGYFMSDGNPIEGLGDSGSGQQPPPQP